MQNHYRLAVARFVPGPRPVPALAGPCTPGLALYSWHSDGYCFRFGAASSRTFPAPSSGMLVKYAG